MFTEKLKPDLGNMSVDLLHDGETTIKHSLAQLGRFEHVIRESEVDPNEVPGDVQDELAEHQDTIADCTKKSSLLVLSDCTSQYLGKFSISLNTGDVELINTAPNLVNANFFALDIGSDKQGKPIIEFTFTLPADRIKDNRLWIVALGSIRSILITRPLLN